MKLHLIAVGQKMPAWVQEGFSVYQKRFSKEMPLNLIEIPALKRSKGQDIQQITDKEGEAMLKAIPPHTHIVTLDVVGKPWSTYQLAQRMEQWQLDGRDVCFLVGGPEGLSAACQVAAAESWSLSALTLPHPMVRVMIAEALYRAWSLLNNHPYHRE